MTKKTANDPFASREAEKYENPVPSREFIIEYLRASTGPLTLEKICSAMELNAPAQVEGMRRRLNAMERDGQLACNRRGGYGTLDKLNLIKGRVIGHPEGYGFVSPSGGDGQDIYLSSAHMRRVFDGDIVLVRIAGWDRRGRPEGHLVDVVERPTRQIVGRYFRESGINFVRPDNPRISQDIMVPSEHIGLAEPGQIVLTNIVEPPSRKHLPVGHITEVLGDPMAPGLEIEMAIRNYGIPNDWNDAVSLQTEAISGAVPHTQDRVDLRALPFITIDGEDSCDFDDAVYCAPKQRGGWKLIVAIADVSHYVEVGSKLDEEASNRGNSVYFPNHVVPMLPEKLSNGLCSLVPHQDRYCLACEMHLDSAGEIVRFQFYQATMHSHARMTYTQVAEIIALGVNGENQTIREQFASITPQVDALYALYEHLRRGRNKRGAIDFDSQETRILFDGQRKISQIVPSERTAAHRLIEECMLCANVCAARLLEKIKVPALYRVHAGPNEERLSALREFLGELGIGLGGGDDPQPEDYQRVLRAVTGRDDARVIQSVMLRSMSQAMYQSENEGHFGLAYEAYTHFTSPIRRYADLLVHRALRSAMLSDKKVAQVQSIEPSESANGAIIYPYTAAQLSVIGDSLSVTERRADEATRDVVNWLKCEYLTDRIGDRYGGVVSAVTGFGLFVMLDDLHVEGLIHITALPRDYYSHEAAQHRLIGERTGRVFRLGQKLHVSIARVALDERKIDFELVSETNSATKGRRSQHSEETIAAKQDKKGRRKRPQKSRNKPPAATAKTGDSGKAKGRRV